MGGICWPIHFSKLLDPLGTSIFGSTPLLVLHLWGWFSIALLMAKALNGRKVFFSKGWKKNRELQFFDFGFGFGLPELFSFPFCLIVYSGFDGLSNAEKEKMDESESQSLLFERGRVCVCERERERWREREINDFFVPLPIFWQGIGLGLAPRTCVAVWRRSKIGLSNLWNGKNEKLQFCSPALSHFLSLSFSLYHTHTHAYTFLQSSF